MKKRILTAAAALALIAALGTAGVLAAPGQRQAAWGDGDGVCDSRTDGTCQAYCAFTDADGDGVCDNRKDGACRSGQRPMDGTGAHRGHHGGRHAG